MEKQTTESNLAGKMLIIVGFVSIAILFLVYARYQDSELITPEVIDPIQRMAIGFYIILLIAFGAISFGLYQFHKQKVKEIGRASCRERV